MRLVTVLLFCLVFASTAYVSASDVSPFVDPPAPKGGATPVKTTSAPPSAKKKSGETIVDTMVPAPPGASGIPVVPQPLQYAISPPPSREKDKEQEKARREEIREEDRFVIEGTTNDLVIITDKELGDRQIMVQDGSTLDNGCLLLYPKILCGEKAKTKLADRLSKKELTDKITSLSKENGRLNDNLQAVKGKLQRAELANTELSIKLDQVDKEGRSALSEQAARFEKEQLPLEAYKKEIRELKTQLFEMGQDMGNIVVFLQKQKGVGQQFNIPGVGPFAGYEVEPLLFAVVKDDMIPKVTKYFNTTVKRAYRLEIKQPKGDPEKVGFFVVDSKQISKAGEE